MALKALILSLLLSSNALACQWSTITRNEDGSYRYPRLCHIEVGKSLERVDLLQSKVVLLEKQLSYSTEIIDLERRRTELWLEMANEADKQVKKLETERYFWAAGGVLLTIVFVYLAGAVL